MTNEIYSKSDISDFDSKILEETFTSNDFDWHYSPFTITDSKVNRSQFSHILYHPESGYSDYYSLIHNIFSHEIPEFKTHRLNRIKSNLNVAHSNRRILPPHRDLGGKDGIIYIYYVNDSDGPTTLHDGWKRIKIEPKKGKLIRFPATTWHTGNVPRKHDTRIIINFVFDS